jgi:nucleoside-diphosphate-sugar epimerase
MVTAGEVVRVREIAEKMGRTMNREAKLVGPEPETALLGNDKRCRELFGEYRDTVDEMIEAAARWVMKDGETWDMPTKFGRVDHSY